MNLFPPTLAYAWILRRAIELAQERHGVLAVHMRTQCTHQNFYDTFTKPHAWWRRDPDGAAIKTQLFARRPIKDHPVLSKPTPELDLESLHPVDRDAVRLAALGTNYANYSMIYVAYLERVMGFHVPHRTIEVPIDLLNRFTIAETGLLPWFDILAEKGQTLRLERDNASMTMLTRAEAKALASTGSAWLERAVVGSNQVNIAQIYQLGLSLMLGGSKMAVYIPEMNRWIPGFADKIASWCYSPPPLLPITQAPVVELTGLASEAACCHREWGISTSVALLASAEGEQAAERLEAMLAVDYAELFDRALTGKYPPTSAMQVAADAGR
jgi:hypothetical protein